MLSLLSAYFTPLWQIQLWAPQYPEGLNMKIWINKLSGAFDIISGLNHYIGMARIRVEMFPEFGFMIYLVGALIALGLFAAIMGTRKWLWVYVCVLAFGGLAGLADFYRWGYQYGHNLDPKAAIQVPGMSYQPPLIGYKNLLNFTAYSGPETGGYVMIASGVIAALLLGWEQFLRKDKRASEPAMSRGVSSAVLAMVSVGVSLLLGGCKAGPEPIRYGQDECSGCKMIISDSRFGAEILTRKGRVLKFDDLFCMNDYVKRGAIAEADIAQRFVSDFNRRHVFIAVGQAHFLKDGGIISPMHGDIAAFATQAELDTFKSQLGSGVAVRWAVVSAL